MKAPSGNGAKAELSGQADTRIIAPGSICNPSDYLRVRSPYRRFEAERQWANHKALAQLERYLAKLTAYRYRLDNPEVHRAV